jgi:uncharacterized protein YqfB (UPF0267 family)
VLLDNVTNDIADLVKTFLNDCGDGVYGFKLVKTTRNWDDPNVPLNDHPVLKVYRLEDNFNVAHIRILTTVMIKYEIIIDKTYKTVPLLNLVGRLIHDCVHTQPIGQKDIYPSNRINPVGRMEVRDMPNADVKGIYTYMFGIEESSVPVDLRNYVPSFLL